MNERVPPLDSDIAAVLAAEKPLPRASSEEKARAFVRVAAACAGSVGGIGGKGRSTAPRLSEGPRSWARAHPWALAASAFTLGAGTGAALHASLAGARLVYVTQVVSVPATASEFPAAHPDPAPPAPPPVVNTVPEGRSGDRKGPSTSGASARPSGDTLAAERQMIDVARRAIGEGDGAAAMAAVSRHEGTFPSGLLREEREALAVRALVLLGRAGEARARAAEFRARYPGSLMAPAVERAVASLGDAGKADEGAP